MNLSTIRNPPANLTRQQRKNWRGARHFGPRALRRWRYSATRIDRIDIAAMQRAMARVAQGAAAAATRLSEFLSTRNRLEMSHVAPVTESFELLARRWPKVDECAPKP